MWEVVCGKWACGEQSPLPHPPPAYGGGPGWGWKGGCRGVWLAKAVRQRTLLLRDEVLATKRLVVCGLWEVGVREAAFARLLRRAGALQGLPPAAPDFMNATTAFCHRACPERSVGNCRRRRGDPFDRLRASLGKGACGKRLSSGLLRRAGALQGLPPAAPDFMNATTSNGALNE